MLLTNIYPNLIKVLTIYFSYFIKFSVIVNFV